MTNLRRFLLGLLIAASLGGAAVAQTTNLGLTKPTVGADADAWGGEINADLDLIDTFAGRTRASRQVLTSGTAATYTKPAGVYQLRIRMVGGGGGGGAENSGTGGSSGGTTNFGGVTALGGAGGATGTGAPAYGGGGTGGSGGSNAIGTGHFRTAGGDGSSGIIAGTGIPAAMSDGNLGGASIFGGGSSGVSRAANAYGSGGAGAMGFGAGQGGGGGGGAGEYVDFLINSPSATYTFTIGAGGAGSTLGSVNGSAGKQGVIIVDEIY